MPSKEEKQLNHIYRNVNLSSWKYRVVDLHLTRTHIKTAFAGLNGIPRKCFKPIFSKQVKENKELVLDDKRGQFDRVLDYFEDQDSKWLDASMDNLQEELDVIYPDLQICFVSALTSDAGGEQQNYHADCAKFDYVRFAGVISYDDETKLELEEIGKYKRTITLLAGHAIIFRGDLFHAGAAYEKENRRIYFKAIPKGCVLKEIEKNAVGLGHICDEDEGGCGKGFNLVSRLYTHHAKCKAWQATHKKNKKRKSNKKH